MIAISTAYKEALIAIDIEGKQNSLSLDSNCKHSENMLFSIDKMLDEMEKSISDNNAFAVVIGPGSFTGLRIGIALLKGLLAGKNEKCVVPLTTFDLMAYSYIKNFAPKENFTCIINGLSGYYFICEYSAHGEKLGQEKMITTEELSSHVNLVGLEEENLEGCKKVRPTAGELLELSKEKFEKKESVSAKELVPMYLRKSQAESGLEAKKQH